MLSPTHYLTALHFFARVLHRSPDEELLRALCENGLFASFHGWECFHDATGDADRAIDALTAQYTADAMTDESDSGGPDTAAKYRALYLDLHQDHLKLFSGPAPVAPPWESVWRERQRLLFGEATISVRAAYATWGLSAERAGREPDDHLALELGFLAWLLQHGLADTTQQECAGETPHKAIVRFLDEHVLLWADECLGTAARAADSLFYRHVPLLCSRVLVNLRAACEDFCFPAP
ncbi:molecular chaperone TorD family protein [Desulfovibrio sp. OttesenSCG-928-I05]|nr:molecular chaperone TorD family protein [Desulfovibrio sp. OttesenSCG-928-I05]